MDTDKTYHARLNSIFEVALVEEINKSADFRVFNKNEQIITEGQYLKYLPIVLNGSIRVFQTYEDREILLYYVTPLKTCIMSLSACLFNNKSLSNAVCEADTGVLLIPSNYILDWQKKYDSWNRFIISAYRDRYDELLYSFNDAVFKNIDERAMAYLENYTEENNTNKVPLSHQALAHELGTTRVVISRILKNFELKGKVILHRGDIELKK